MTGFRERVELSFASLCQTLVRHKLLTLLLSVALLAITAAPSGQLRRESSMVSLFHKTDPARVVYESFQERFGKDDLLLVVLQPDDVFATEFLSSLEQVHKKLAQHTPYLAKITSLVNVRDTRGENDQLLVEELMPKVPKTEAALKAFRQRVLANPSYRDYLVSSDGKLTAIVLEPLAKRPDQDQADSGTSPTGQMVTVDTAEFIEMYAKVREIAEPYRARGIALHYAGHPVLAAVLQQAMQDDVARLMPLAFLVSIGFLVLLFRNVTGVLLPILIVTASILSTFGCMVWLDIPMTNVTVGLFALLTVVGLADAVHILSIFYRCYRDGAEKEQALTYAFGHSGLPVLLTTLTTGAGLMSLAWADVAWVADFGLAAPIGVAFAFVYTLLFLPALVALLPVRRPRAVTPGKQPLADRCLIWIGNLAVRRSGWVIASWLLLLVLALVGLSQVRLSQNGLKWFPENHPIRTATKVIDDGFGGTLTFEISIDSGKENGLYDAQLMQQLSKTVETFERYQRNGIKMGKAISVATVLKEVNQALNNNDAKHYKIPDSNQLIAQELLLFEMSGSDDLERMVSTDYRHLRLTLTVPFADAILYLDVLADIEQHLRDHYAGLSYSITGMNALFIQTVSNILTSMAKSYPIALVVVTVLMIVLLGRIRFGLLSMVPNLAPILIIIGAMGWLEIPFDFSTMLIGAIAIGLVVDDTIHFLHTFAREQAITNDVPKAVRATLLTTGRAIFITSMTLAAGFWSIQQRCCKTFSTLARCCLALCCWRCWLISCSCRH